MHKDVLHAAARRLSSFHERFRGLFGRREAQQHSQVYIRGLLSTLPRKNVEAIALTFAQPKHADHVGEPDVVALQSFVTASPWRASAVQQEIQAVFSEELAPSSASWPLGTVGVIDESGFAKQGTESVGVAHQYCGRFGKTMNCQVGVFLVGVTPGGSAVLDHELFLPESWIDDSARRKKTQVPRDISFRSKPEIAVDMIRRTHEAGHVQFSWIVGDKLYGSSGPLVDALEDMGQRWLFQVKPNRLVWVEDPKGRITVSMGTKRRNRLGKWRQPGVRAVKQLTEHLPDDAWRSIRLREGAKGPLVYVFARIRVWLPRRGKPAIPVWLVFQRSLDNPDDISFYISNAEESVSLETLALVAGTRWHVEEVFEDAKGHLGMADYETRAWTSWHHHMSLVALAHLYVTLTKRDLKSEVPELTLDMAVRILRAGLTRQTMTPDDAINIVEYHLRRNRIAKQSHRKSWIQKHQRDRPETLL